MAVAGSLLGAALRVAIRAWQLLLAPVLPPSCRYVPSCSHYAEEAIARHGAWRGGALALGRLCRCHPWGGSGYDPVPDRDAAGAIFLRPAVSAGRRRAAARHENP